LRRVIKGLGAVVGIAMLAACTSGQAGIEPPSTGANVQATSSLQFRVGTANYNGATYLNTVTTFRQANGLSATLYNSPTITGPAGFTVPAAGSAGTDAGTDHISSTPPTQPGTPAVATTFNQTGGVYAYGFAPANSNTTGVANYAQFSTGSATNTALTADYESSMIVGAGQGNTCGNIYGDCDLTAPPNPANAANEAGAVVNAYTQPFFVTARNKLPFLLGPPAVPDFHSGNFPSGFLGYDSGFTMFGATPVAGQYSLTVNVPGPNIGVNIASFTQTASLASTATLPAEPNPTIASTGGGGASFVVAPAPAGVTNQVLYVVDISASSGAATMYSFDAGAAGGTFSLSATAGPKNAGGVPRAPFAANDSVYAYVVGADYDIVGAAPPTNTSPSPSFPAQTDVTVSPVYEGVYSSTAGPLSARRATSSGRRHLIH
jgi:hypothetical protein